MDLKILDETLNFLNTGNITLNHVKNLTANYKLLSHIPIKKEEAGLYKFHNDIQKKIASILKSYDLKCKIFGIYSDDSLLQKEMMCTILIVKEKSDDDYDIKVAKLMSDYKGGLLANELDKLSSKVEIIDANYCYTKPYGIYSIDITYKKS